MVFSGAGMERVRYDGEVARTERFSRMVCGGGPVLDGAEASWVDGR